MMQCFTSRKMLKRAHFASIRPIIRSMGYAHTFGSMSWCSDFLSVARAVVQFVRTLPLSPVLTFLSPHYFSRRACSPSTCRSLRSVLRLPLLRRTRSENLGAIWDLELSTLVSDLPFAKPGEDHGGHNQNMQERGHHAAEYRGRKGLHKLRASAA